MSLEASGANGAIYVAEVRASLPSITEVSRSLLLTESTRELESATQEGTSYIEEYSKHDINAMFHMADGRPIRHGQGTFFVDCIVGRYVVIQAGIGDDDEETFTSLFSRQAEQKGFDGVFACHTAYVNDAGIYFVPATACNGGERLVEAVAFLCMGAEATNFYTQIKPEQIAALEVAADILLSTQ